MKNITKKKANIGLKNDRLFYYGLFALPLLQFIVFYLGVNINSFLLAFKDITLDENLHYVNTWSFNGFRDAFDFLSTDLFSSIVQTSFWSYLIMTAVSVPLGLLFAYYIAKKFIGCGFFRIFLFLPSILSSIVMVTLYRYFVDSAMPAIFDDVFGGEHLSPLSGTTEKQYLTIIFYNIWVGFGVNVLMYANAMSAISPEIIEAAKLDGAIGFKEFWHIILPLVFPTLSVFLVVGIAGIFTNQLNLYSFYGSDPSVKFQTFGYYLYCQSNKYINDMSHYPMLSAFGLMMTAVAVPLTFLVRWLLNKYGPNEG